MTRLSLIHPASSSPDDNDSDGNGGGDDDENGAKGFDSSIDMSLFNPSPVREMKRTSSPSSSSAAGSPSKKSRIGDRVQQPSAGPSGYATRGRKALGAASTKMDVDGEVAKDT